MNTDNFTFVTGPTGFIGRRLVHRLKEKEEGRWGQIKVLSRMSYPEFETVVCDLQSDAISHDALEDVETIFHLAGYSHDLSDTSKVEHLYRAVNVDATLKLAELAVASSVKRFVFVSSVKAGGSTEDVDVKPEGVYGQTKREAELAILELGRQSGMHVSIVRPALVYGPGLKGNLALMRRWIEKGWFPPLPETGNRRSMIHVDDLVQALMLVAKDDRANGEIYIATDGESYSSRQIYEAFCAVVDKAVPQWSVPRVIFDIVSLMSSRTRYKIDKLLGDEHYSSKKLQSLGFKAQRSLREMNETAF